MIESISVAVLLLLLWLSSIFGKFTVLVVPAIFGAVTIAVVLLVLFVAGRVKPMRGV